MSDIMISAENLGKKYLIGHQAKSNSYETIQDLFVRNSKKIYRLTKDFFKGKPIILGDTLEEVWALQDVNFNIHRGEVIGIIGRNGAGKSTLLKVLSRITEPSSGRAIIKGSVASLLEVGTGFHPELTGRENIYLNGAILGMTRKEVSRKFDEIVDFSEIGKYLDTPVKRYSSGMYVRLAFSVAAHLEPDILLVDEVLAVGDIAFQKKCMSKMGSVAEGGKTVVFVSHNMASIKALCPKSILIDNGSVIGMGDTEKIIADYYTLLKSLGTQNNSGLAQIELPKSDDKCMKLIGCRIEDDHGDVLNSDSPYDGELHIEIDYEISIPDQEAYVVCTFTDYLGTNVIWQYDAETNVFGNRVTGLFRAKITIPKATLRAGIYDFCPAIVRLNGPAIDYKGALFHITIDDRDSILATKSIQWPSSIKVPVIWSTETLAR